MNIPTDPALLHQMTIDGQHVALWFEEAGDVEFHVFCTINRSFSCSGNLPKAFNVKATRFLLKSWLNSLEIIKEFTEIERVVCCPAPDEDYFMRAKMFRQLGFRDTDIESDYFYYNIK